MILLLDLASLSSGTIVLPRSCHGSFWSTIALAYSTVFAGCGAVESSHVFLSSWHYLLGSVGSQSLLGASLSLRESRPPACFPRLCRYKVYDDESLSGLARDAPSIHMTVHPLRPGP